MTAQKRKSNPIQRLDKKLDGICVEVKGVKDKLNNIQVNGRMGLNEAFQDIFKEIRAMKEQEKSKFWNKTIGQLMFSKNFIVKLFWLVVLYIIITVVLQVFGIVVDWNAISDLIKISI